MHIECMPPAIARIAVTVTGFHDVRDGRGFSRADVELIDTAGGRVTQARVNDPIEVHGLVYLEFFLGAGRGDRHSYSPVGISFREKPYGEPARNGRRKKTAALRDPLGHAAFPLHTIAVKGDTAQLSVFDANPEPGDFEFDLIIQRSDGRTGIIDPPLRNRGVLR